MIRKSYLLVLLFFVFSSITIYGQTAASNTLGFTAYPTSVSSLGMGNNSVAFTNADDALTFNPANLVFIKGANLSFFRNPYYSYNYQYPLTNLNFSFIIPSIGAFSLEYRNQSFIEVEKADLHNPDGTGEKYKPFFRGFTLGYARCITDEISIGASIRYAGEYLDEVDLTGFLFSLGTNYNPKFLENRLSIGFSIMNLGSTIEMETRQYNIIAQQNGADDYTAGSLELPPPGYINLGANFKFAKNEFYSAGVQLAFSKPIIDGDGFGDGKSSFESLFSDWQDFPRDVNLHTGIAYEWEPISLGNDITFLQEMYFGNNSFGIKNGNFDVFTHGVNVGVGYQNFELKLGYTGTWHFGHLDNSINNLVFTYPRESWQFSFNWATPKFLGYKKDCKHKNIMKRISLLAGTGYSMKVGNYSEPGKYIKNENSFSYYLEADFYFNSKTALISNFTYSPYKFKLEYYDYKFEEEFENISFSSSFRYHPLNSFLPLYVQTGLGIYRTNPVQANVPKYSYKTFFTNRVGASFDISSNLILQPEIDWILLFDRTGGDTPRLKGQNQFDFSIKFGYSF